MIANRGAFPFYACIYGTYTSVILSAVNIAEAGT